MTAKQQRIHWFLSHLADVLTIALLVGILVYVVWVRA